MSPPVFSMDQKVITVPQVEETAPPARRGGRVVWVAVAVVLAAVVIGGAVLGAVALYTSHPSNQSFQVGMAYPQRLVPEHVTVDEQQNIIRINEERVGNLGGLQYLHSFDKKLTAILDTLNKRCYITPLHETLQGMVNVYSKMNGSQDAVQTRHFEIVTKPIDSVVLRTLGGEEIADHCRDVPSHWVFGQSKKQCASSAAAAEPVPAANSTVSFRCSHGAVFDPESFSCRGAPGQPGQRSRRAVFGASLSVGVLGDCCSCCCCCQCKPKSERRE